MPRPQPRLLLGGVIRPRLLSSKGERELVAALIASDAAAVERAVRDPKLQQVAGALAGLLYLGSDDRKAEQHLEKALEARWGRLGMWDRGFMAAHFSSAEYQLGLRYEALGVEVVLKESLDLTPRTLKLALSLALEAMGELPRAVEVARQVQPEFLNPDVVRMVLADQHAQQGDFDAIVALTEGVTNKYNYGALLCAYRGMALRMLSRPGNALEVLREALRVEQRLATIRFAALVERSRTFESTGNLAAARKELKRILAENPSVPGVQERLDALRDPDPDQSGHGEEPGH